MMVIPCPLKSAKTSIPNNNGNIIKYNDDDDNDDDDENDDDNNDDDDTFILDYSTINIKTNGISF